MNYYKVMKGKVFIYRMKQKAVNSQHFTIKDCSLLRSKCGGLPSITNCSTIKKKAQARSTITKRRRNEKKPKEFNNLERHKLLIVTSTGKKICEREKTKARKTETDSFALTNINKATNYNKFLNRKTSKTTEILEKISNSELKGIRQIYKKTPLPKKHRKSILTNKRVVARISEIDVENSENETINHKSCVQNKTSGNKSIGSKTKSNKKSTNTSQPVKPKQSSLNPKNMSTQRQLFFDSNCTINPVFEYENIAGAQKLLRQYQEPKRELLEIAKDILEAFIAEYGTETNYFDSIGGRILTQEETQQIFYDYIKSLGIESCINIAFAENTVTATTITHDSSGKSTITIGLPIEYHRNFIQGVLDHEIGTHYLRKANNNLQIWNGKNKKAMELNPHIVTEEGFAALNQLFYMVNPLLNIGI